ncbi:hypothetical protein GMOD_00004334 [Pyrenophora seminiperda CCB06]|uniref:Uncharacterized protein n=1 Tax=Pyrenophora seminiperda CCB06 TaxID=1302712 RepID=A0A3M7M0V3_9PLEO|nr:hypothetical protein GMOD_00004334 [Pyrenophora seminiperda CCB06]
MVRERSATVVRPRPQAARLGWICLAEWKNRGSQLGVGRLITANGKQNSAFSGWCWRCSVATVVFLCILESVTAKLKKDNTIMRDLV